MQSKQSCHYGRIAGGVVAGVLAFAGAAYALDAGLTWYRYGSKKVEIGGGETDSLLDLYMLEYEAVKRHAMMIAAPAEAAFSTACGLDLSASSVIRSLFKIRELALDRFTRKNAAITGRSKAEAPSQPKELRAQMKAVGWSLLAEIPGREIVFGAVTQPWVANPVFRAVPTDEFAGFSEPGFVKIAWALRADPISASRCRFRTETRVIATDAVARSKFRGYWALVSPGVTVVRRILLHAVKTEAERRVRKQQPAYETAEFGEYAER